MLEGEREAQFPEPTPSVRTVERDAGPHTRHFDSSVGLRRNARGPQSRPARKNAVAGTEEMRRCEFDGRTLARDEARADIRADERRVIVFAPVLLRVD